MDLSCEKTRSAAAEFGECCLRGVKERNKQKKCPYLLQETRTLAKSRHSHSAGWGTTMPDIGA
eukprot:4516601-Prymnesium_polylepis.1